MQGDRVVDSGGDSRSLHALLHAIPIRTLYGVLRIDTGAVGSQLDLFHAGKRTKQRAIALRDLGTPRELPVEALQLGQHDRALQRVHASAHADTGVMVASLLAMHANLPH